MSVFVQRTTPVTTSKVRINADDLENPVFPTCARKFWIVDNGKIREMTTEEKLQYYPTQELPVAEQKAALLAQLSDTDYQMARAAEEYFSTGEISEPAKSNISARVALRAKIAAL